MRRRGFTLVELLIVLIVITVLASISLATLRKSMRYGQDSRVRADLNTISFALEAYRADFGDYPRPTDTDRGTDRGARILAKALLGNGDMLTSLPSPLNATLINADGANGPGFRLRKTVNGSTFSYLGRPQGPYLSPDFKPTKINPLQYDSSKSVGKVWEAGSWINVDADDGYKIVDYWGNPIIYYVAKPFITADLNSASGYVATSDPNSPNPIKPFVNAFDNLGCTAVPMMSESGLRTVLSAKNDGAYNTAKTPPLAAYYLISAGADGVFGTTDDIIFSGGSSKGAGPAPAPAPPDDIQIVQGSTATLSTYFVLPNSGDIQTYFDVQFDLLDPSGAVFATAQIIKLKPTWRGNNDTSFTSATVALTASRTVTFPPNGGNVTLRVSAKYAPGGHASGRLAMRYDCVKFPSSISVETTKGARSFFLHDGSAMNATDNTGDTTINDANADVKNDGKWVPLSGANWQGLIK